VQLPAGGGAAVAGPPDLPAAGFEDADLLDRFLAEGAARLHHCLEVADLIDLSLDTVAGGAPADHLLGVDRHQVRHPLLLGAALLQQVGGGVVGRVVHHHAGVAVQEAVDQDVAGKDVQWGAVAGHVFCPLVPKLLVVALQVDALAEDRAGRLGRQPLQEGRQRGVEDAAVIGVVVFAGFAGDDLLGVGAQRFCAAGAKVDHLPERHHGYHRATADAGVFAGAGWGRAI